MLWGCSTWLMVIRSARSKAYPKPYFIATCMTSNGSWWGQHMIWRFVVNSHQLMSCFCVPLIFAISMQTLQQWVPMNWLQSLGSLIISSNAPDLGRLSFDLRCMPSLVVLGALSLLFLYFQRQFWMRKYITSSAFRRIRSTVTIIFVILSLLACLYTVL